LAVDYRIGCSGWSYQHWRGDFYPKGLPATRWLEHYASVFDTVELNGTFYRLPSEPAVESWRQTVPGGFRFSAKVSRLITHFRRLRNTQIALQRFLARIRLLDDKLGPLLYQLPPNLERDAGLLADFLDILPRGVTHVFEFRHHSWWTEEVYDLLRRHDAGFCVFDMGKTKTPVVATSATFYMRLHGPEDVYSTRYSGQALAAWAKRIRKVEGIKDAWLYFNNDIGGHAPRDAQRLRDLLSRE
jgi:uncharacterized protein YecE (DUF72 family)